MVSGGGGGGGGGGGPRPTLPASRTPRSACPRRTGQRKRRPCARWRAAGGRNIICPEPFTMAAWAKTPGPVGSWAFLVAQEAAVVAVLAWFLLGPEELFRLSKALGSWLGEARGFVAETAAKYESSLDDASTRKAIAGIRETQRTVSEVASSFQAIATTVRDPLNLSSALSDTMAKYERKEEAPASGTSGAKQAIAGAAASCLREGGGVRSS
ncbi:unnamed protein product [Prorocentrum cordatum]|uniref:Uncharacterized protein n=2 Tax=Prorocentrum cordatum TaxID=2364126 RepID=A0ABN9XFB4_9DINO|nr:unnamed protein product [Polarella glacialis]